MDDFLNLKYTLTPQEINSMKAEMLERQAQMAGNLGVINNGASILNTLGTPTGTGYLLGQALGQMYNNYRQSVLEKKARETEDRLNNWRKYNQSQHLMPNLNQNSTAENLGQYGKSLIPTVWQTPQPNFQQNLNQQVPNYFKPPENGEYFSTPVGDFFNYGKLQNTNWQPTKWQPNSNFWKW